MTVSVEETGLVHGSNVPNDKIVHKQALTNGTDNSAVLYSILNDRPPKAVSGNGCWITTEEGHEVIDSSGGAAVACLGHNNQRVAAAMMRQLSSIAYCYAPFFTSEPVEKLARALCESTGNKMSRAFIVSSGTESIEAALKMARQYFLELSPPQPQRIRFIARRQSYHGNTLGSLSLGGHVVRKAPYLPIMSNNISHVSPCYPYRDKHIGETDEAYIARLAQELEDEFQSVGPDTVCAFVAETITGTTMGPIPPPLGYLKAMRSVCDRHGALLILDEVMSGMGRTGTTHAWQQEGIIPDLQTIAKGLGAGFVPIGALLVNDRVISVLDKGKSGAFIHSQTYQGHPVACAAAYEVQQIIKEDNLLANVREMGTYLGERLKATLGVHKHVGDIRGRGLFWGIEFVQDKDSKDPFPADRKIAPTLHRTGLQKFGVSTIPGSGCADGTLGDMVLLAPPYIVSKEEIDEIVLRMERLVRDVLG